MGASIGNSRHLADGSEQMMSIAGQLLEEPGIDAFVDEVAGLRTQFDLIRFMRRVTEHYDCRTFIVFNLPAVTSLDLSKETVISNWPAEMIGRYERDGLMKTSPVLRKLRGSTLPFTFDLDKIGEAEIAPATKEMFLRVGAVRGACFPVHDMSGGRGGVSFAGLCPVFTRVQMMELMCISQHVFERLAEIRNINVRAIDTLTGREVDCLNWTAAGKTSSEIANILGLSEHTVNHYLNRAAKKLDTVNRTQAVAKALRTGLIK